MNRLCVIVLTLLSYAPVQAQPRLPGGEGKKLVERSCGPCHGLQFLNGPKQSKLVWQAVVDDMAARGARGSAVELKTIVDYLATHFGKQEMPSSRPVIPKSGVSAKINLVTATASTISGADWPVYGHDPGGMRYSPLTQITPQSVTKLTRAWTFRDGEKGRTFEATPLVIGGVMYLSTSAQHVIALEPETGRTIWEYDPRVARPREHRGVSYWAGDKETLARILLATSDGRLIALNAITGQLATGFGDRGVVNLRLGVADKFPNATYSVSSPPALYKNLIILGPELQEGPSLGPAGDPRAFDVHTGKLVWRFHSVPRPGEPGNDTWGPGGWKDRSGPSAWGPITVDSERGLVFVPTGNPADAYYGGDRKGTNLYANCVLALDAANGQLRWYFQTTHHDIYDYDASAPPALIEVTRDGTKVPAVALITKMTLLFILDRMTGKPIYGVEERPAPKSDVPGEESWPTQPFPLKPLPLGRMSIDASELSKVSPEAERYCRELLAEFPNFGPYTPYGLRPSLLFPSGIGGGNWGGVSFDPALGYIFVNVSNLGTIGQMVKVDPAVSPRTGSPVMPYRNGRYARFVDKNGYPCNQPPWGELAAVNANTGDIAWKVPLSNYDELQANGSGKTGAPSLGGTIATASGLVFVGGTADSYFRAFDSRTGKELWAAKLEANASGTPITYLGRDGKQYVVVASGGNLHFRMIHGGAGDADDSLIAFALP